MRSFDSDLADRPLVFDTINAASLFFFIESRNGTLLLKIFISWNSLCFFFPISLTCLMVDTTSYPITSLVPIPYYILSWINSFDSSDSKGFPSWLNSFVKEDTCFANVSWKDLEPSYDENQNIHSLSTQLNPQTVKQLWLFLGCKFAIYKIYPHLFLSQVYLHTSRAPQYLKRDIAQLH